MTPQRDSVPLRDRIDAVPLLVGVLLVIGMGRQVSAKTAFQWVTKGLENAGSIILITGAGGAFGNILRVTGIADSLARGIQQWQLGIVLPFVIAAVLKSAQGSSTVAIITTAALSELNEIHDRMPVIFDCDEAVEKWYVLWVSVIITNGFQIT